MEQWRAVVGFEGLYEVSDNGRVRSLSRIVMRRNGRPRPVRARILSPWNSHGYAMVSLRDKDIRRNPCVHTLVLEAFVGPCPEGNECCHGKGGPLNNRLANLRWDTRSGNCRDTVDDGHHNYASRTHCKNGHEYTEANTYYEGKARRCRECRRQRQRQYMLRKNALVCN